MLLLLFLLPCLGLGATAETVLLSVPIASNARPLDHMVGSESILSDISNLFRGEYQLGARTINSYGPEDSESEDMAGSDSESEADDDSDSDNDEWNAYAATVNETVAMNEEPKVESAKLRIEIHRPVQFGWSSDDDEEKTLMRVLLTEKPLGVSSTSLHYLMELDLGGSKSCGDSCGDDSCGDDSCGDDSCGDDSCGDDSCGDDSCGGCNESSKKRFFWVFSEEVAETVSPGPLKSEALEKQELAIDLMDCGHVSDSDGCGHSKDECGGCPSHGWWPFRANSSTMLRAVRSNFTNVTNVTVLVSESPDDDYDSSGDLSFVFSLHNAFLSMFFIGILLNL
ncbi:hypothetical protein BABINDRAFT_110367 [Babjeviella inositovora NRRL Y-12698]|uniref:Uncharacterized protein n=1 Tax=Babjeviella inositovora NRRL Y-12698 TaxID=984486 RepID=A0A1E3QVL3_9ASCO|nr:uncharacterized protein BABINDRAFT_110367 [Babjeviella inositovora NRRL Y-12698]ODQ81698.1 hypothetical protein BABINDRAFT_110367 [Babjeviella inositovora NRRL Y-12698]